jgi:dolichol-phosphate mannosyltransferase
VVNGGSGGPALRRERDEANSGELLARPAPQGADRSPAQVVTGRDELPRRPDARAAWVVDSFELVDELVRRGVDSARVLVETDRSRLAAYRDGLQPEAVGEVLVPPAPFVFPGRHLVVVPTYDERENLPVLLAQIPRWLSCDVLVVDDGSPDGTGELADRLAIVQPWVHVMHRTQKAGLGRAYLAGFRWALERGYDRVYEMDADLSHAPWDLPRLAHASSRADLVIGSRYVKGGDTRGWSLRRRLLSRFGNVYARTWLGFGVHDWTAGYRCMNAATLARIDLDAVSTDGYAFQIEMAWRFRRAGGVIAELPVHFVDRNLGRSKMCAGIALEAMRGVPRLRFRA